MRSSLAFLLVAASLLRAEPPRAPDVRDGWKLDALTRIPLADGDAGRSERASGVRLEGMSYLGALGDWRATLSGSALAVAHRWKGPALPTPYESVREVDLGVALVRRAGPAGGASHFAALELASRTADSVAFEQGLEVSSVWNSSWALSPELDLGFAVIAETRAVDGGLVLAVPTFRWRFSPGWSLGTGRKALILGRTFDDGAEATLSLGYSGEETRVEPVAQREAHVLDERLYLSAGVSWRAGEWQLRGLLGYELDSNLTFDVAGSPEQRVDPGRGLWLGLSARLPL